MIPVSFSLGHKDSLTSCPENTPMPTAETLRFTVRCCLVGTGVLHSANAESSHGNDNSTSKFYVYDYP
jgi:hypothetical protein